MADTRLAARNPRARAGGEEADPIPTLIDRARHAMATYAAEIAAQGQARIDEAVTALAWSIYKPENARRAGRDRRRGDRASARSRARSSRTSARRSARCATCSGRSRPASSRRSRRRASCKYAKPVGVVGAITPSTNPSATPVNKAMMALKGGNAIIIAPPPTAWAASKPTVDGMRAELEKIGLPADLVQILPNPVTREATTRLMELADLVVVTGSQVNVRQAYKSGKPALGVGLGNAPVIIDASADLAEAAQPDHAVEDLRPRHLVLVGERRGDRRCGLRQGHRRAGEGGRLSGERGGEASASSSGCGRTASSTAP